MSKSLLGSKVVVIEQEPKVRGIPSAPTSVTGAVGVTEKGPIGQAVLCTSFDEYEATFGGFSAAWDLPQAVKGFFENGGNQLWIASVGTFGVVNAQVDMLSGAILYGVVDGTVPYPFALAPGDTLSVAVDTVLGGGNTYNVTIDATAATLTASAGPYDLTDGGDFVGAVNLIVDGTYSEGVFIDPFSIDDWHHVTAAQVVNALNAQLVHSRAVLTGSSFQIESLVRGGNSSIELDGGNASDHLNFTSDTAFGGGNVPNVDVVDFSDVYNLFSFQVESGAFILVGLGSGIRFASAIIGPNSSIQVTGTAATKMGIDTSMHAAGGGTVVVHVDSLLPGTEGDGYQAHALPPTGGVDGTFDFLVHDPGGVEIERFADVSRDTASPRFIDTIVNDPTTGSAYVRTTNLAGAGTDPPDFVYATLAGGSGGVTSIPDSDFIGDEAANTGFYALDEVQDLAILMVPGRTSSAIHNAMLSYCEVQRDGMVFAVLDSPRGLGAADMVTYVSTTASLENASEYGAIYWPWVAVQNPSRGAFGDVGQIVVPPSGIVAGIMARTDGATPGGIYRQPAGTERGRMFGVLGFETTDALKEAKRDLVYPHRINPLTTGAGLPRYVDGSRTLKGNGAFPSVAERRGVIFIERSLRRGLAFARHRNNTPELRAQVQRTITAFLLTQMKNGAFKSDDPATAFFVDVSDRINPPSAVLAGKLTVRIGLATNKPAEFVILEISQDTRAIEAELAGAGA